MHVVKCGMKDSEVWDEIPSFALPQDLDGGLCFLAGPPQRTADKDQKHCYESSPTVSLASSARLKGCCLQRQDWLSESVNHTNESLALVTFSATSQTGFSDKNMDMNSSENFGKTETPVSS